MPRATEQERIRRDARIVADRARGFAFPVIADRNGVSARTCRDVWNAHLADQPTGEVDTALAVAEALEQLEVAMGDLAGLAQTTANDAVRLGAIKARVDVLGRIHELQRISGRLPATPRAMFADLDIRRWTDRMLEVFDKYVPEESLEQAELELTAALP